MSEPYFQYGDNGATLELISGGFHSSLLLCDWWYGPELFALKETNEIVVPDTCSNVTLSLYKNPPP